MRRAVGAGPAGPAGPATAGPMFGQYAILSFAGRFVQFLHQDYHTRDLGLALKFRRKY